MCGACVTCTVSALRGCAQMRSAAYKPEQVDDIPISHLHPDHVAGLVADGNPVFIHATVHVAKADAEFWLSQVHAGTA